MKRIFKVQINLDTLAAILANWETDKERSDWLTGFQAGCYGAVRRLGWSAARTSGYEFGSAAYQEAANFSDKQRVRANIRWGKGGCQDDAGAMPPHQSGTAGDMPPHMPDVVPEAVPDRCNPTSNIQHPESSSAAASAQPPPPLDEDLFEHPSLTKARPSPSLVAEAMRPRVNLADLQVMFPALLVMRDDHAKAEALLRLYGAEGWQKVLPKLTQAAAKAERGKNRVLVSAVQEALALQFELDEDDYRRAGLPVPDDAKGVRHA